MVRFVVRRISGGIILILLLTLSAFVVANAIPQNKACIIMACTPQTTREQMNEALHRAGFDRPVVVQYADYLWRVVRDHSLGTSWGGMRLDSTVTAAVPVTASLVAGGMILTLLLALPLGAYAALRPRSTGDRSLLTVSIASLAVHPFVLGIGVQQLMARVVGTPTGSYCPLTKQTIPGTAVLPGQPIILHGGSAPPSPCGGPVDWALHLIGPWIVFALFFVPIYLRMIGTCLIETLGERYVLTARAKGAGERRVVVRHALRNAVGPLLPMIALDAGTAITAAIYIETIFGLPGMGALAVMGLSGEFFQGHYDLPFILALVMTIGVFVVVLSTAADIATAWLDPRVRSRVVGARRT